MGTMTDYSDLISEAMMDHRFGPGTGASLTEEQVKRLISLREHCRLLARHILQHVPPSFERDQALVGVDEAMSWSARAISRHEGGPA